MSDLRTARERMVQTQIAARGIRDPAVLEAMRTVPREAFLPPELAEFAYEDPPLPIAEGQTISQPYIVALMTAALELAPDDRVLEIGTGSGYAAAILGPRRARGLHDRAPRRARRRGGGTARARSASTTSTSCTATARSAGREHAPYDAIVVAAGGPDVPEALLAQLAVGGRLVIPIGEEKALQTLVRVTREADGSFRREDLGDVRFVPLIGAQGWAEEEWTGRPADRASAPATVAHLLREVAEPIAGVERRRRRRAARAHRRRPRRADRRGDPRHLGVLRAPRPHHEGAHPVARLHHRRRRGRLAGRGAHQPLREGAAGRPGARVARLRALPDVDVAQPRGARVRRVAARVERRARDRPVGFYGLDLYSLYRSIRLVLDYLDRVDPDAARTARERYGCLTPWEGDPGDVRPRGDHGPLPRLRARGGRDAARPARRASSSTPPATASTSSTRCGNARVVANAERYYRAMYYGGDDVVESARPAHVRDAARRCCASTARDAKAVLWEHNSHLGDAAATEMGVRGQLNVGHLCRAGVRRSRLPRSASAPTTAPSPPRTSGTARCAVMARSARPSAELRAPLPRQRRAGLLPPSARARARARSARSSPPPRLERAIGVVYRPETELQSHYFHAILPQQFDEYVWFDETHAVRPVTDAEARGLPRAHPFAPYGPP